MGGILDLGAPEADFCISWGKNVVPLLYRLKPRNSPLNVCLIDRYDDLLLLGHRLVAQLQVFASGGHFYRTNFQCCSTVVHRVTSTITYRYDNIIVHRKGIGNVQSVLCMVTAPSHYASSQRSPEANTGS